MKLRPSTVMIGYFVGAPFGALLAVVLVACLSKRYLHQVVMEKIDEDIADEEIELEEHFGDEEEEEEELDDEEETIGSDYIELRHCISGNSEPPEYNTESESTKSSSPSASSTLSSKSTLDSDKAVYYNI